MTDAFARSGKLWNAIYGCWMGKNCGGTLGAPLEKSFGEPEPFDVWWYPKLQAGGIPNDDLEMQLLWLKALEEVGPTLNAGHLTQYWLDHIGYNWDEYGFSKHNLRLGLRPPVSGHYNNWFRDCMGCPIRSEIWACVAPGHPRVAAKYAFEDAICDHAGGESVHGELFNVAIEAAAFVVADPKKLIDIGLSYVGEGTQTRKAIQAALDAHQAGVDWKEARRRALAATPNANSQYSPPNMAFQVIGWLWGDDFGDAICKAVNCGYDTDCTGATLGSYLGIILGKDGLPRKWVEPLGESIATNESWGGLRHASAGPNPIPADLASLTDRTVAVARKVLAHHGIFGDPFANVRVEDLYADDSIRAMVAQSPLVITTDLTAVKLDVDYIDTPAIIPGTTKPFRTILRNPRPDPIVGALELTCGLAISQSRQINVAPRAEQAIDWSIDIPKQVDQTLRCDVTLHVAQRPATGSVPVVFIGATKLRVCGPLPFGDREEAAAMDAPLPPEELKGDLTLASSRTGDWHNVWAPTNEIPIAFDQPGVVYVQTFIKCADEIKGKVAVACNGPTKVWFNGQVIGQAARYRPFRPDSGGGNDGQPVPTAEVTFKQGWNEVLIKFVRGANPKSPFAAHLVLTEGPRAAGLVGVTRTRFPWDE